MLIPLADKIAMMGDILAGEVDVVDGDIVVAKGKKKKWMQQMTKSRKFQEGALRKQLGIPKGESLTIERIDKELDKLEKKYPDGGYSKEDLKLQKRLQAAKNMMSR